MLDINIQKKIDTENGEQSLQVKSRFEAGKIIGIFGNSGQGKTTLFNMISGIVAPDSGKIVHNDQVWFNEHINKPIQKRGIGYIFQGNSLFPNFTIRENILYAVSKKERNKINVDELITQVGLGNLSDKYPKDLSGGQIQRAVIARILLQKANLVLMDEPFTGLDFEIKYSLFKQLRQFRDDYNLSMLLITHDIDDILHLCDSVYILQDYEMRPQMSVDDFKSEIKTRISKL